MEITNLSYRVHEPQYNKIGPKLEPKLYISDDEFIPIYSYSFKKDGTVTGCRKWMCLPVSRVFSIAKDISVFFPDNDKDPSYLIYEMTRNKKKIIDTNVDFTWQHWLADRHSIKESQLDSLRHGPFIFSFKEDKEFAKNRYRLCSLQRCMNSLEAYAW